MGKFRSILLLCLGFLLVHVRGQRDFDLADALDHPEDIITRKPTVIRRPTRPVLNNDLHLGDALGDGDIPRKPLYPPLPPRPGSHSNSGGFDDSDLLDGKPLPPHITGGQEHHFNHGGNTDSGLIAGVTSPIISAFVILIVGSIVAYSAYKNKRLCFKPHAKSTFYYGEFEQKPEPELFDAKNASAEPPQPKTTLRDIVWLNSV
ncbi:CD99 antigen-like [Cariama cristata]